MIDKLRNKLMQINLLSIIIIMLFTMSSAYIGIGHMAFKSSKKWLLTYLDTEMHEAAERFQKWERGDINTPDIRIITAHKNAFNNVAYWINADNKLIMAEELDAYVAPFIKQTAMNWDFELHKIRSFYFELPHHSKWHFFMAAQDVFDANGKLLGRVVVGTNMSPLDVIANRFIAVALGIALLISCLAFLLSRYFASKAVEPIKKVLQKQKEFISDSSHELCTPLSVLLSSVDLLEGNKEDKRIINNMRLEILSMRDLVNSLLLLARNDNYEEKLFVQELDAALLIKDTVASMQLVAAQKQIEIGTNVAAGSRFKADEVKVKQLLIVLLDNAIKYSPEQTTIIVEATKKNNQFCLSVQDEGEGIKPEDCEKIFDRFYRVDKARSRSQGGFGLGLAVARQIVEAHQGKIEIESTHGLGSRFIVWLPL